MKQRWNTFVNLLKKTASKSAEDEILTYSAAIAFYTIFSTAPILILLISVGSLFLQEETVLNELNSFLGAYLDQDTIRLLSDTIFKRVEESSSYLTTAIAIMAILFGATTVIMQLKVALNKIWNVHSVSMNTFKNFLFNRLISFGLIMVFSLLLVTSLLAEALLGAASGFISELIPFINLETLILSTRLGTVAFAMIGFACIFKILPDVHAPWRDVLVGAFATTLLFMIGKTFIGFYLSETGIDTTYRAAGSLVVFVIWVYFNIFSVLIGAVFTQVYTEHSGGIIRPYRFVTLGGSIQTSKEPYPKLEKTTHTKEED
jgi:membrane protein